MPSMLGQLFGQAAQQNPMNNMIQQFQQLQQTFKGNPAQQVPLMLQRAGIPDSAIKQCMAQATEFMKAMKGSR